MGLVRSTKVRRSVVPVEHIVAVEVRIVVMRGDIVEVGRLAAAQMDLMLG